jgi:hypothetical protein
MKINFNRETSKLLGDYRDNSIPDWLKFLQLEWLKNYDIDPNAPTSYKLMWQKQGVSLLCEWLKTENYIVNYWELPIGLNGEIAAYGIDFNESCEKFIELKLKFCTGTQYNES